MNEDNFKAELAKVANKVEKGLKAALSDQDQSTLELIEGMRLASLDGGKRIRPFLVHASSSLFSSDPQLVEATALAIECIHCFLRFYSDWLSMRISKVSASTN